MASRSHTRFQDEYLKACRRKETDPLPGVLEACKSCFSTLNLSGHCLTVDNCMVLGKCLCNGHPFQGMNFSDCLMGDEGIHVIRVSGNKPSYTMLLDDGHTKYRQKSGKKVMPTLYMYMYTYCSDVF